MLLKSRLISREVALGVGWVVVSSLLVSIPISLLALESLRLASHQYIRFFFHFNL